MAVDVALDVGVGVAEGLGVIEGVVLLEGDTRASDKTLRRTRLLWVSAMSTLPSASTATPAGALRDAEKPGPPSPAYVAAPVPTSVEMIPPATTRTRLLSVSAMATLPIASTARPVGPLSRALVAAPVSPLKPLAPAVPHSVEIVPPAAGSTRTVWRSASDTYSRPRGTSSATPVGSSSDACVAGKRSPREPPPAMVVMVRGEPGATTRTRALAESAKKTRPSGCSETPMGRFSSAEVAALPSPLKPAEPVPASVVMTPPSTSRRAWLSVSDMTSVVPEVSTVT